MIGRQFVLSKLTFFSYIFLFWLRWLSRSLPFFCRSRRGYQNKRCYIERKRTDSETAVVLLYMQNLPHREEKKMVMKKKE